MTKSKPQLQDENSASDSDTLDLFAQMTFVDDQPTTYTQSSPQTSVDHSDTEQHDIVQVNKNDVVSTDDVEKIIEDEKVDDLEEYFEMPVKTAKIVREPKSSRRKGPKKAKGAFKTISEVATHIGVPQHVLRFWESKFTLIKPMKRGGGRRYYRPEDIEIIERIHHLLYHEGYTIKGVQRLIKIQKKSEFLATEDSALQVSDKAEPQEQKIITNTVSTHDDVAQTDNKDEIINVLLEGLKEMRKELNSD